MTLSSLTRDGDVFVLRMTDEENRFNRTSIDEINASIDEVEAADGPKALVVTGEGKFFSNGLDLDWLSGGEEDMVQFVGDVTTTWARVLRAPYPTVAALNGHAFAGGAMFALSFDQRVMRRDRGYWCVNEVLLGMNLTPGMGAIIQARLAPQVAHKAITTAHRFGGDDALANGLVDCVATEAEVVPNAIALAATFAPTASANLGALKERMYGPVIELLNSPA